jgi:hypothetical protein
VDAVSVPKARNSPPSASGVVTVRVGHRQQGGEVSASLKPVGGGYRVVVNAAHLPGISADVSLRAAAELRNGLTALLRQAGYE